SQTSRPSSALPSPVASGLEPLAVLVVLSLPSSPSTSQAQPEPNCVVAAVLKLSLKASTEPKSSTILASSLPGSLPPVGDNAFQKWMWFQCWPALLNTGAMSALSLANSTISSSDLPASSGYFSTNPLSAVT